jgi:hypothetical protein
MRPRAFLSDPVEWTLVTAGRPCRVCGSRQGCRSGSGGEFACCATLPSEWPLTIGGWVHRIGKLERASAAPSGA